ncbi:MAG: DUF3427 domain-containing protein [Bacilli bacterium]|nr:DUF3427 domain-containing protein [Bacilli bacterium]
MISKFLSNNSKITFLDKIKDALKKCNEFSFSVSFIKKAGLVLLYKDIDEALKRGAIGKLITSTYQNFTDPSSLDMILSLAKIYSNFECHLDLNCFGENGFHTKGYLFKYNDCAEIVVGSSNITRFALLKNIEWNVSIKSINDDETIREIYYEFQLLWDETFSLSKELIAQYNKLVDYSIERWDMDYTLNYISKIKPNYMQMKALKEISKLRSRGINKALIIAATGSGKTYLAAFDAKNFDAKRLLFVVHRDTILHDAMETFRSIFGARKSYGFFNSKNKDIDADFIFSTNFTLSTNLDLFNQDEFDYIIIDEVHHATAATYQEILSYFNAQFLLGLTATPERMDNESVFDLFEKNVPYELRLRDALINELVVPFKYYGINDSLIDYSEKDVVKLIRRIADDIHIEFVKENIEKYRPHSKLKALGFCRTIEHARLMSEKMNYIGYHTTFLTGKSDTGERLSAYKSLEADDGEIEILFAVDLLNEGIDIPAVNMVLFLRPTESATIFIQQLGRGLRKYENKTHLIVLDFIANSYTRSVQIALAIGGLSHSNKIDKRLLALYVRKNFSQIDLPIEVHIDEIAKEKILESIEKTNFNTKQILEQEYRGFKKYLGIDNYIKHMDYLNSDVATDITRYIKKYGSYYHFLYEINEDVPLFTPIQMNFLKYLSSLLPLVRSYEYKIVKELIKGKKSLSDIQKAFEGESLDMIHFDHALNNLQYQFYSEKERRSKTCYIVKENELLKLSFDVNDTFIEFANDLLDYGIHKFDIDFYNCSSLLNPYFTYDRTSLLTVLCHHTLSFREGIFYKDDELYLFVDLKKDEAIKEWLKFKDKFLSDEILQWESSTSTTFTNSKGHRLIKSEHAHLLIRKIEKEDGITLPYIYIGKGTLTNPRESDNVKKSLLFDIILENKIPMYLKDNFEIPEDEDNE